MSAISATLFGLVVWGSIILVLLIFMYGLYIILRDVNFIPK